MQVVHITVNADRLEIDYSNGVTTVGLGHRSL